MANDAEHRIRERAYHLWEAAGRPHGRDGEFWHEASRMEGEGAKAAPKPKKAKPPAAPKAAEPPAKPKKAKAAAPAPAKPKRARSSK